MAAQWMSLRNLRRSTQCGLVLAALLFPVWLPAVTLSELLNDPKMNPKRFAGHFEYFKYKYFVEVQPPEVFLSTERGDCDDYATLADSVLARRGFQTRLIQVRLAGLIDHAVCYVTESRAYLDYNNRAVFFTLARSKASIREIATKVAASQYANWTSALEFTWNGIEKQVVATVVKTAPPESDPVPGQKTSPVGPPPGNSINVGL